MKVKFNCDSGANIQSCRSGILDTIKDLNLEEGEWETMSEEERFEMVKFWADDKLEIWYDELSN